MATWIFQGNPQKYDIEGAVQSLSVDTWLVKQHKNEIRKGDRAYLWESGAKGGIVAVVEVLDDVADRTLSDASKAFVRDMEKLGNIRPRVQVRISKRVKPILKRSDIKRQPGLENLSILKFAHGTNFEVTAAEAKIIDKLIVS